MFIIVSISILCLYFIKLSLFDKEKSVYAFIPFNYLYDLIVFGIEESTPVYISLFRLFVIVIFYYKIGRNFLYTKKPAYIFFIALIIIVFFSIIGSAESAKSYIDSFKFLLIIFSFFIFYTYFKNNPLNNYLFKKMINQILIITVFNILISNIFTLGWAGYSDDVEFYTGGIVSNMWYVPALAIVSSIYILNSTKKEKNTFLIVSTIIVLFLIIIGLRRSALIILLISIIFSIINLKLKRQFFKIVITTSFLSLIILPFALPIVNKQLNARNKTFEKGMERESRYRETNVIWEERLENPDIFVFLFGNYPFDTVGKYGKGIFEERPLHVDLNIIFFSFGILGLIVYNFIFLNIYVYFKKIKIHLNKNEKSNNNLSYLFNTVFFSQVALSFSGGLNAMTFRFFIFILLALSIGQLEYNKLSKKIDENN